MPCAFPKRHTLGGCKVAEEGFLVACHKALSLFSFKTKEESLTIITTCLLAPQGSLSQIFLPILHSYVYFSMTLCNCIFFSYWNGALSTLYLLYHLAQRSAHSRSSITQTHRHTDTQTHRHTQTHTHTHTTVCSLPTLSGSEVLWTTELRVTRISRG